MKNPIYPWLLSIYPVLHLYSRNLGAVRDDQVVVAVGAGLVLATVIFLAVRLLARESHRPALTTAVLLILFFSYGHLAMLAADHGLETTERLLLPVMLLCGGSLILGVWLWLRGKDLAHLAMILNVVTLFLLILPATTIASHWVHALMSKPESVAVDRGLPAARKVLNRSDRPDIYYIITDGYSSNSHLLRDFDYDNSPFTEALEDLGFFVAYDSRSNYGATLHSLSSSLNLRYVQENAADAALNPRPERQAATQVARDLAYLRGLVADSEVARFLIARGYTYIFMLSGYLLPSRIADINIDFTPSGAMRFGKTAVTDLQGIKTGEIVTGSFYKQPFYRFVSNSTLLRLFSKQLEPILQEKTRPYHWSDTKRFFATLEETKKVAEMPEATFAFVHLLEPHEPIQLRRERSSEDQSAPRTRAERFFEELEIVNEHLLATLRAIIGKSTVPPIIILQGDHGTNLGKVWSRDRRLTHFNIMNAFLLPGERPDDLKSDISPVNTFRVVFNAYFGAEYKLLEVRLFDLPKGYKAPFEQVDVTEEFMATD